MAVQLMSKPAAKDVELLQAPVDSLVPGESLAHSTTISLRNNIVGCTNASLSPVASISNNHLARTQHPLELGPEDANIRPGTTSERSIRVDDVSSLDTNTYLIPETSLLEFMRVPPLAERCLLIDLKINAVNSQ